MVGPGSADVAAGDIDVEAKVCGVRAGCVLGPEVGLAGMDGPVTCVSKNLGKGGGLKAAVHLRFDRLQAVEGPLG